MYAYYARSFTVKSLTKLYTKIVKEHNIDSVVLFDGGSDSLVVGDENGLGDPIEDAVSIATVADLPEIKVKIMISVGFGSDRFNDVSDASSLRAVAELTALGGFLGCVSVEPNSEGHKFYERCVEYIYQNQIFRSVATAVIISSIKGSFGFEVPPEVARRATKGQIYLWPLMAIHWAFDVNKLSSRSLICKWIRPSNAVDDMYIALRNGRRKLGEEGKLRGIENLPTHEQMRS